MAKVFYRCVETGIRRGHQLILRCWETQEKAGGAQPFVGVDEPSFDNDVGTWNARQADYHDHDCDKRCADAMLPRRVLPLLDTRGESE